MLTINDSRELDALRKTHNEKVRELLRLEGAIQFLVEKSQQKTEAAVSAPEPPTAGGSLP